jgi:hypothetical protein
MSEPIRLCHPAASGQDPGRTLRPALSAALFLLAVGVVPPSRAADIPAGGAHEVSEQGLAGDDRRKFYHLSFGSQVFPIEWTRCLEDRQTRKPFLQSLERFGFLPDAADPDGLPIGMSKAKAKAAASDVPMLGVGCGMCHVGQLTYRGQAVRIDGAPNMIQFVEFGTGMAEAVRDVATDPSAFAAFQLRLVRQPDYQRRLKAARAGALPWLLAQADADDKGRQALARQVGPLFDAAADWPADPSHGLRLPIPGEPPVTAVSEQLGTLAARIRPGLISSIDPKSAGREAAATQASELLVETLWLLKVSAAYMQNQDARRRAGDTAGGPGRVDDFRLASNLMKPTSPALPANSPTSIPHVWGTRQIKWLGWDSNADNTMQRNIATAIALGSSMDHLAKKTSMVLANIYELEELASKIPAPRWPEKVFGPIDPAKVARGRALFGMHCARCHPTDALPSSRPFVEFETYDVGTDPNRARNFKNDQEKGHIAEGLKILLTTIEDWEGVDPDQREKWKGGRQETWQATGEYAGRPWWPSGPPPPTAQRLGADAHDLLLPAAQRPKQFLVGGREFDPVKVGYQTPDGDPSAFRFDTDVDGNSNAGHEGPGYGTDLPEADRMALLEYLKAH